MHTIGRLAIEAVIQFFPVVELLRCGALQGPPTAADGTPLLAEHPLPHMALREALDKLAIALLTDMLSSRHAAIDAASTWAAQSKVAFTEA